MTGTPGWAERAACRGHGPALFYPAVGGFDQAPYRAQIRLAAQFCAACPVRADCDQAATSNGERWGVWAGHDRTRRNHDRRGAAA